MITLCVLVLSTLFVLDNMNFVLFVFWTLVQTVLHYRSLFYLQQGMILPDISMLPKNQEGGLMSHYLPYFSCTMNTRLLWEQKTASCAICMLSSSIKRTSCVSCSQRMLDGVFQINYWKWHEKHKMKKCEKRSPFTMSKIFWGVSEKQLLKI